MKLFKFHNFKLGLLDFYRISKGLMEADTLMRKSFGAKWITANSSHLQQNTIRDGFSQIPITSDRDPSCRFSNTAARFKETKWSDLKNVSF